MKQQKVMHMTREPGLQLKHTPEARSSAESMKSSI